MRNKGLIIVFAVLFGLVSLYQLSYTFIANKVEKTDKIKTGEGHRPSVLFKYKEK